MLNRNNKGRFIKGHQKVGDTRRKTPIIGINNPFYGKHHTEETKIKIRLNNHVGKIATANQLQALLKGRQWLKGKTLPYPVWNKGLKGYRAGALNNRWKGGITPINRKIRGSFDAHKWRREILRRDDYRCFDCGQRGGSLEVHHIYPFAAFPRIRFVPENGITLCKECHRQRSRKGIKQLVALLK